MKVKSCLLCLILVLLLWPLAPAEADWDWPAALTQIEADAFSGNSQFTSLSLPEGIVSIGDSAFSDCPNLQTVRLPSSLAHIGDGAFDGCAEALYFTCSRGTAARDWAVANGFDYSAETVCRALIIGQTYTGTDHTLYAPANDMRAMQLCLSGLQTTHYVVTYKTNLTIEAIDYWIDRVFSSAAEDDISLFYFSGHGTAQGELVGADSENGALINAVITPSQLKAKLDAIPGRKVIIVDACYSGHLIEAEEEAPGLSLRKAAGTSDPAGQFTSAFLSPFRGGSMRKSSAAPFAANGYYVLTACRAQEKSHEMMIESGTLKRYMSLFTYSLLRGLGYDGVQYQSVPLSADSNADGVVTLQEAYDHALHSAQALAQELGVSQTALVYPAGCTAFSPFRP